MRLLAPLVLGWGLVALASPAPAAIIVTSDQTYADAYQNSPNAFDFENLGNTFGTTAFAELLGFSNKTTSDFDPAGFSTTFAQTRAGGDFDSTYGYSEASFTANSDDSYSFNGSFANSTGLTSFGAYLIDLSEGGATLFYSEQSNLADWAVALTLGNTAGNDYNSLQGSLTGSLQAGHDYRFVAWGATQAYPDSDGGATASGGVELQFGSGVVPEPASLAIWGGMGLVGLVAAWRRKRSQATKA